MMGTFQEQAMRTQIVQNIVLRAQMEFQQHNYIMQNSGLHIQQANAPHMKAKQELLVRMQDSAYWQSYTLEALQQLARQRNVLDFLYKQTSARVAM